MRTTFAILKARVGGYVGRGHVHPAVVDLLRESASAARSSGLVLDAYVARCGDVPAMVVTHEGSSREVLAMGQTAFGDAAGLAGRLGQHDAPGLNGNGGLRVEATEIAFAERHSEPVLVVLTHGAGDGALSGVLYRAFGDPFNTSGLLHSPAMMPGFRFTGCDRATGATERFDLPDDLHRMLATAGVPGRLVLREVASRASGEVAAVASVRPDPVLAVRCEDAFPAVGEILAPFTREAGLMPVSTTDDASSRPPARAICLGFQVTGGRLVGPRDMFADRAFDDARRAALAERATSRGNAPAFV